MRRRAPEQFPRLRVGEAIEHDGRLHTVIRVTDGAAHIAPGDWRTDGGVLLKEWNSLLAISPRAQVRRLE